MNELTKRQKQIVDMSLRIISSGGIQSLTIKNLAEKVKVTEGAIYRHFKSKADILATVADLFKSGSTEILNKILNTNNTGIKKIKFFFLNRLKQFAGNRGLMLVMFSEDIFKNNKNLQKKIFETVYTHKQLIIQAIIEDQKLNKIRNDIEPEHIFVVIMGALRLLVAKWRGLNFKFDLNKEGEKLWDSIEKLVLQYRQEV